MRVGIFLSNIPDYMLNTIREDRVARMLATDLQEEEPE